MTHRRPAYPHPRRMSPALCALLLMTALPPTLATAETPPVPNEAAVRQQAQQTANEIAQHLLTVQDDDHALVCSKAVENARYGVETMLEVAEKNVKGGYMPKAQFDAMAPPMRELLGHLTVADCEAASGPKRDFYQCMSSDYNHVMACGNAHRF